MSGRVMLDLNFEEVQRRLFDLDDRARNPSDDFDSSRGVIQRMRDLEIAELDPGPLLRLQRPG